MGAVLKSMRIIYRSPSVMGCYILDLFCQQRSFNCKIITPSIKSRTGKAEAKLHAK